MDRNELVAILSKIDIFTSFTEDELSTFAASITEIHVEPDTVLFEEGDSGLDMYILLEGKLQILKENRTITTILPIDYIGEMAIIEDKPRSATVISNTRSRLLKITSFQFQKFFSTQPKSLVSMMRTLSLRIRQDTELIAQEFEKANILIHDMKNAMSGLLLLDFLQKDKLTETQSKHVALMQKCRKNLSEMINEALSNAKRLHYAPEFEKSLLSDIIEDIKETADFHPDLKDKTIQTEIEPIPAFPFYKIDISRVITNLVINAGQASSPGGNIHISLFQDEKNAVVKISDNGSGIPAKIHSKVFLPHFTTKENGNGFGLASCKQIVEKKHGGTISFTSSPGSGTSFMFTLPMRLPATIAK